MTRRKKQSADTVPPAPGVDEAPTAESPSPPVEEAPVEGGEPEPQAAEAPPAAEWPVEDQPTLNLTGTDLDALTREDVVAVPAEADVEAPTESEEEAEDEAAGVEHATDISRTHLRGLLEALIFASDKPLKSGELARLASARVKQVRELLKELEEAYTGRGIVLAEVAGGWLFRTSVEYAPFVREMTSEKPVRLTRAQVETLAITAYRQPITRPEIDDIRGVDSGATLKLLLERDLVRILGKKDEPGRPLLYGTTGVFLEFFGLKSLKDLPTLKEFTELSDESRRTAEAELGDVLPEHAPAPTVQAGQTGAAGDTLTPPSAEHDTEPPPAPEASVPEVPDVPAAESVPEVPPVESDGEEGNEGDTPAEG